MTTALMLWTALWLQAGGPAFARADAPREWDLPADHRAHPDHALEWWYLTGDLRTEAGDRFGYQATFFRSALSPPGGPPRTSPFAARELLLWHGSLTEVKGERFLTDHEISRAAAGWAAASPDSLDVHVGPHGLRAVGPSTWQLRAGVQDWRLELDFTLDRPPVLHGESPGWSRKGQALGNSSYYVSRVHLTTRGALVAPDGRRLAVSGESWFDQEFGSGQLDDGQEGWDWFSANLADGSALMIYRLRERGGAVSPASSGTWVNPDGSSRHLKRDDVRVTVDERWRSPASGAEYPIRWTLSVPSEDLVLRARPVSKAQERGAGPGEGAVVYWEGLTDYEGLRRGKPLQGSGYVELVGYAAPFDLMR